MRDHGRFMPGDFHPFRRPSQAITEKDIIRFWSKVDVTDEGACWLWLGSKNAKKYGAFGIGRKLFKAHRLAYCFANDVDVTTERWVLHACDNPPCCNPAHLFLGDSSSNVADMHKKGRARYDHLPLMRGEDHHGARLNESSVLEIRVRRANGERGLDLARHFGVAPTTISEIVHGRLWPHVGGPRAAQKRRVGQEASDEVVALLLEGATQRDVAVRLGIHPSRISRIAARARRTGS